LTFIVPNGSEKVQGVKQVRAGLPLTGVLYARKFDQNAQN